MPRTQTVSDYEATLVAALRDPTALVRARFKGRQRGQQVPWMRVEMRPVKIRAGLRVQLTDYDDRRAVARNPHPSELAVEVRSLVGLKFASFFLETRDRRLSVQVTRRGRALIQRERVRSAPRLDHDRRKLRRLTPENSTDFLETLGLCDAAGRIVPTRFGKYRQINAFVRIVEETADLAALPAPLRIVDFGCGNAYLTFALFHYLDRVRGLRAELCGVDRSPELLARNIARRDALGWSRVRFETCRILDFEPSVPPAPLGAHAAPRDPARDPAGGGVVQSSRSSERGRRSSRA